jgi:hypothetical protein
MTVNETRDESYYVNKIKELEEEIKKITIEKDFWKFKAEELHKYVFLFNY